MFELIFRILESKMNGKYNARRRNPIFFVDNYSYFIPPHRKKGFEMLFEEFIRIHGGDFPDLRREWIRFDEAEEKREKIMNASAIVLSGSGFSLRTFRSQRRFSPLMKVVKKYSENGGAVIGICFGHQLLGHMFGAKVQRMADRLGPKKGNEEFGRVVKKLRFEAHFPGTEPNAHCNVVLNHHDEIITTSKFERHFHVVARSEETGVVQAIRHKSHCE